MKDRLVDGLVTIILIVAINLITIYIAKQDVRFMDNVILWFLINKVYRG